MLLLLQKRKNMIFGYSYSVVYKYLSSFVGVGYKLLLVRVRKNYY